MKVRSYICLYMYIHVHNGMIHDKHFLLQNIPKQSNGSDCGMFVCQVNKIFYNLCIAYKKC